MTRRESAGLGAAIVPALLLSGAFAQTPSAPPQSAAWRTFQGSWSAVGRRYTVPTEGQQPAAIVQLSGAVTLTDGSGANIGFQGEAIGFDNGAGLSGGRVLWTDARGHRVFSTIRGEPVQTGRRITGTFTGGTGPYAGATGDYTLTWQYVVKGDDESFQGRAADLMGRFRSVETQP